MRVVLVTLLLPLLLGCSAETVLKKKLNIFSSKVSDYVSCLPYFPDFPAVRLEIILTLAAHKKIPDFYAKLSTPRLLSELW